MGILTKYPIEIEVDETPFNIVVSEPNKQQKEELKEIIAKSRQLYSKRDAIKISLSEKEEEFEINKHILKDGKKSQRVEVMLEQKKLIKYIFKEKSELIECDNGIVSVDKTIENIFSKRYDILISGQDKESLKDEIDKKAIPYQVFFDSIAELIVKAKEKK